MSYDLVFFPRNPAEDWDDALDRLDELVMEDSPLSEPQKQRFNRAAERIVAIDGAFERFESEDVIELSHPTFGIQASMFETSAGIGIAYWHTGQDADAAMRCAGAVVDILIEETGWSCWDGQLGKGIARGDELLSDGSAMMDEVTTKVPHLIAGSRDQARRAWWQFWKR